MHGGNGLKYDMLLYPDHLQKWLDYGYGLVIFLNLVLFWFSETGQICGFRAFAGKPIEEMAWNFACVEFCLSSSPNMLSRHRKKYQCICFRRVLWGLDKMVHILLTTFSNIFCLMKNLDISINFHWNVSIYKCLIHDKCNFQVMAWCHQALSEPRLTKICDAAHCQQAIMS